MQLGFWNGFLAGVSTGAAFVMAAGVGDLSSPPSHGDAEPGPCTPPLPRAAAYHTADLDRDYEISLSELLRVIQLYNAGAFHCASPADSTEDGYAPGPGDTCCAPHLADFAPQDWQLSLIELLRVTRIYERGGYKPASRSWSRDGFQPGKKPLGSDSYWYGHVQDFLDFLHPPEDEVSFETFDSNEYGFAVGGAVEFFPNGIPDAAEFAVLQFVLGKEPDEWRSLRGLNPNMARYVWDWNYEAAGNALGAYADLPGWQFVVASYMSIGDFGSVRFIREQGMREFGIVDELYSNHFRLRLSDALNYERSPNKDPYSNIRTWQYMKPTLDEWEDFASAVTGFTRNPLADVPRR